MQRLEVSCAVRRIYTLLGAKGLMNPLYVKLSFPHTTLRFFPKNAQATQRKTLHESRELEQN